MQLPILETYELEHYDSVRLFLQEDSKIFKYLADLDTSHDVSGRVFIKGKFIKVKIESSLEPTYLPLSQKYYFIEASDISKLKDPNMIILSDYSEIPDYILEIDQEDIVSIELLLDYKVK